MQILLTQEEHAELAPAAPLLQEIAELEESLKTKTKQFDAIMNAVLTLPADHKTTFFAEYQKHLKGA